MTAEETMCYVAQHQTMPGFYAASVHDPNYAKDTAKAVAGWIKEGAIVSRVTVVEARAGLTEYLSAKKLMATGAAPNTEAQP